MTGIQVGDRVGIYPTAVWSKEPIDALVDSIDGDQVVLLQDGVLRRFSLNIGLEWHELGMVVWYPQYEILPLAP